MNRKNISPKTLTRNFLLSTAIVSALAGFSFSQSGILSVAPSHAQAVSVEAPAVFSFGDVVEAVSPAVVSVRVEAKVQPASDEGSFQGNERGREFFERFFRNGPRGDFRRDRGQNMPRGNSQGSGFFVSDDGYLVTNNHVVEGGNSFTVVLNDGKEYDARMIGTDERTDLAVLKVDTDETFTYVDFGDTRPRIGDWVVAVGNPFGLGGTVTAGIVSAHGREIGATRYDDFIQIDAAVNKGNSGGPAFNLKGEVVGVNTAIFSPSGGNVGIAFAIPAALADEIVTDLIEDGEVTRGWLGVQIQPMNKDIAESLGLDFETGTIVTSTQEDSPAARAGLKSGDIITAVDGKQIKGPKALARVIAGYEPNAEVALQIWRDGTSQDVVVKLGELETVASVQPRKPEAKRTQRLGKLGLSVQPTDEGLAIVDVKPNSPAARRGLEPGDVIASVNGREVGSLPQVRDAFKDARDQGRKTALLQIQRNGATIFVPVPVRRG